MTNGQTVKDLLVEYIGEYHRTTGKHGSATYNRGWFTLPNGDKVRCAEFEKMIETLKSRPTVTGRNELVNGEMKFVEAHRHVVKSLMPPHLDVIEDRDTPYGCSVKDEAYWSN